MGSIKAGQYELLKTSFDSANKAAHSYGVNELDEKPFTLTQRVFSKGKTNRNSMPVLKSGDIPQFQYRLKNGYIDVNKPFAPNTNENDPFPNGISKVQAKQFLINGLLDGDENDDKIKISLKSISANKLKPLQSQIYLSEVFDMYKNRPESYFTNSIFLCSEDNRIIDGHHRFAAILLFYPDTKMKCLKIGLPIDKLLPLSLTYSSAIGNPRNESIKTSKGYVTYAQTHFKLRQEIREMILEDRIDKINESNRTFSELFVRVIRKILLENDLRIKDHRKLLKNKPMMKLMILLYDFGMDEDISFEQNLNVTRQVIDQKNYIKVFEELKQQGIIETI